MTYQRLSVRRGLRSPDVLTEGVPSHLRYPLSEWLKVEFGWHNSGGAGMNSEFMRNLAMVVKVPVHETHAIGGISDQIISALFQDEDLFLDSLDATLHLRSRARSDSLRQILNLGASAWTVNATGNALERRVEAVAAEAFAAATSPSDAVSDELNNAWTAAFGRNPDPSDAWDHSIKALEELLIPLVIPGVAKPNLGGVAGELHSSSHKWKLRLSTNSTTLDDALTLEAMVRAIWPNPDRHGGGIARRTPTGAEAESVVHLAIAIAQLCRSGGLFKLP